jgi:hypothetical protein
LWSGCERHRPNQTSAENQARDLISNPSTRQTGGDTIDEVMQIAPEVLAFAAQDWREQTGKPFPKPRSIDKLRKDNVFQRDAADAIVVVIPLGMKAQTAE